MYLALTTKEPFFGLPVVEENRLVIWKITGSSEDGQHLYLSILRLYPSPYESSIGTLEDDRLENET